MWKDLTGFLFGAKWHHEVQFWSADPVLKTVYRTTEETMDRGNVSISGVSSSSLISTNTLPVLTLMTRSVSEQRRTRTRTSTCMKWRFNNLQIMFWGPLCWTTAAGHQTCVNNSAIQNFPRIYDQQRSPESMDAASDAARWRTSWTTRAFCSPHGEKEFYCSVA